MIDQIADRRKLRESLAKRGTQVAHKRMQMIAELEREASAGNSENNQNAKRDQIKDNFGQNDEDWDIYKNI